ncbi:MAG: DEAD/DEAH box helicase family protein [Pyrinomonadaceae bacterium]|nr:DEAD/DEAH box helicase family protein [Pyrinomonadaceae bacterium]
MKIKFKKQQFQTDAVNAVVDCFKGQGFSSGIQYRVDPGVAAPDAPLLAVQPVEEIEGFANERFRITEQTILENIHAVQKHENLPLSGRLVKEPLTGCDVNLDIEMETGTGKTYCYIKTMFEMNKRFGWSKFIVVVPSIAIREGVRKSFEIMREHFLEEYHKQAKVFIYNSGQLHNLQAFSSDAGINVMIINVQAFASKGKENLRIYGTPREKNGKIEMVGLDDFQSRKPIDVIRANRPILILDEPQKMSGDAAMNSLKEFDALMTLRYSATHKKEYNRVYRLDALDAYNQKLVKKIAVRGISVKGLTGTNAYFYLDGIQISRDKPPMASVEFEVKRISGNKRETRKLKKGDNLMALSELDAYDGFVVSEIDARTNNISFTNGVTVAVGEVLNDPDEQALRQIQIREAVKAHFEKEKMLFNKGIKVLTLFFIDEVKKYREYEGDQVLKGEYARMFEEEYDRLKGEYRTLIDDDYTKYIDEIETGRTHNGYFSIDKKTKHLVNPSEAKRGETKGETDDVDAYDLILKDKERLLSFEEPTRFIFSHSALREGWDNPNVFVICTLKHSDNTISRRQEVGRGMRLSVNQAGDRIDEPAIVHDINVLTVVTSDSYTEFVSKLQKEISESLSGRPLKATKEYFTGKILITPDGDVPVTSEMAHQIYKYLVTNDYIDEKDHIAPKYHEEKVEETLAILPLFLEPYREQVFKLIDGVFDSSQNIKTNDATKPKNLRNANFEKKEFLELWDRINKQAAYTVSFDSDELIKKSVAWLNKYLTVDKLQFTIHRGEQTAKSTAEQLEAGTAFTVEETSVEQMEGSIHSDVKYDLIGKVAAETALTRRTIALILSGISRLKFGLYKVNPEAFIANASLLIKEQKAAVTIEHLSYDETEESYDSSIFTVEQNVSDWATAGSMLKRHIYDYALTDSASERRFVDELDSSDDVVVYAKLPKSFAIPTPVGNHTPDWAISFNQGSVKHIYFVAETKGSLQSLQLRQMEKIKIDCARKFFEKITSDHVKYDVVDSYGKLMQLVK